MFKDKIIYWDYAFWIAIYSILIITIGGFYAKLLEHIMPKYDPNKNELFIIGEIYIQIILITVGIYIMKEYLSYFFKYYFKINKNPEKFATLVLASFIIAQQPNLYKKIRHNFLNLNRINL